MSVHTSSPWIHQLDEQRLSTPLDRSLSAGVLIVGAGIAGISTAFFILKHTEVKKVIIVEAGKIAHGATGHNAGQIVSYFEHPFTKLVEIYGETMAARAQEEIYYAWDLLDEMYRDAGMSIPLARFTGYAGCSSVAQIVEHLKTIKAQRAAGLDIEGALVASLPYIIDRIPQELKELYARIDHKEVMRLLETDDPRYIGVLASRKGCVNSALFCQEMVRYLVSRYADRLQVFEHSPVDNIILTANNGTAHIGRHTVVADSIVLCTNGFSQFSIHNQTGVAIDGSFHHSIVGKIGYMAAYLENDARPPAAISYFLPTQNSSTKAYDRERTLDDQDPYIYLTRRPFEHRTHGKKNLLCIGGPESDVDPLVPYTAGGHVYPYTAHREITDFMRRSFRTFPYGEPQYAFLWHGLMGYTPSGVRCIGPDPDNSVLMYNIGCNGVGILSSIYGGKRISNFITHRRLEPSIFDPQRARKKILL